MENKLPEYPPYPEKYTDDDGVAHVIFNHKEYVSLVDKKIIHANTLVFNGKHWNYHARYANPENKVPEDKFGNIWNRMK